jgi:hypothetical protein
VAPLGVKGILDFFKISSHMNSLEFLS